MLVISSREFRDKQKFYFEKVDNGENVIVQRGKDKSYSISSVSENDIYFNEELLNKLKKSISEANTGHTISINTTKEIKDLLGL
jgi:PHD/YefM family antitoxin component YafN of YafNO toxin-antitoxin module